MKTILNSTMRNKMPAPLASGFRACSLLLFALMLGISANAQCTYYQDNDEDGFGNQAVGYVDANCDPPNPGYVTNNLDCDDGFGGETWADNDGDGYGFGALTPCGVSNNSDCNDNQRNYEDNDNDGFGYPAGPRPCGGVTNNLDCNDFELRYQDNDGDGFGFGIMIPCGGVNNNVDCDDTPVSGLRYPDNDGDGFGSELYRTPCGGVTNNDDCDDNELNYEDNDGDGYGSNVYAECYGPNSSSNNIDCDDTPVSGLRYADVDNDGFGSMTIKVACGGVTNNLDCNDLDTQYEDNDGDGYGSAVKSPCSEIDRNDDCNDNSFAIHPDATELLCDGLDNDCNGVVDAGAAAISVDAGPNKIVYKGYPDSACTRLQSTISGGFGLLSRVWSTAGNSNLGSGLFINVCPTSTRIYYLTVTDGNGCIKRDSVRVCVIDVRCGNNLKSVTICHGTGSATNPFVTLCVGKTETNSHFLNHPGEQLGACGMVKTCNWPVEARLETEGIQDEMEYIGAFPNPFSNTATIQFTLPENDFASVKVFDVAGRELENLFEGATEAENIYTLTFDGTEFSNGIYFLLLNTRSGLMQTKKLMLNK